MSSDFWVCDDNGHLYILHDLISTRLATAFPFLSEGGCRGCRAEISLLAWQSVSRAALFLLGGAFPSPGTEEWQRWITEREQADSALFAELTAMPVECFPTVMSIAAETVIAYQRRKDQTEDLLLPSHNLRCWCARSLIVGARWLVISAVLLCLCCSFCLERLGRALRLRI